MVGCSRGQYSWSIQLYSVRKSHILTVVPHTHLVSPSSSIPELQKTEGHVVIITSSAAQVRIPNMSEYCISKHAINRFVEFIGIGNSYLLYLDSPLFCSLSTRFRFAEYPDLKVFSVHPGTIKTALYDEFGGGETKFPLSATVGLSAATVLYLTAGKADYLSGRYISSTWDLGEVERDWKEKIVTQNCLVNKLSIPE